MAISPKSRTPQLPVRVIVVDDHVFMRDLMVRTLGRQKRHYAVVGAVGTASEAISLSKDLRPDVLILDVNLPDRSGIDAVPDIKRVAPLTRVLLCTGFPTDDRLSDLASTGAYGFVEKTNTWNEFLHALERVTRGEYYFSSRNLGLPGRPVECLKIGDKPYLTAREKEIVTLIAQGLINKEIAVKLRISIGTVETHRTNSMNKLRVRNAAEITDYAFRTGLVKPGHKRIQ